MAARSLVKAIDELWSAEEDLSGLIAGGLWLSRVPAIQDKPFCAFFILSGRAPQYMFDTATETNKRIENPVVQFSIYDHSSAADDVLLYADKLKAKFDHATLVYTELSEITHAGCQRYNYGFLVKDPDGPWHFTVDYHIIYQEAFSF